MKEEELVFKMIPTKKRQFRIDVDSSIDAPKSFESEVAIRGTICFTSQWRALRFFRKLLDLDVAPNLITVYERQLKRIESNNEDDGKLTYPDWKEVSWHTIVNKYCKVK